jgi:hypothetical protein
VDTDGTYETEERYAYDDDDNMVLVFDPNNSIIARYLQGWASIRF